ncbi:MAG: GNAT family N-acetyltransferase [Dokdonella sp.]
MLRIFQATTPDDIATVRVLLREYQSLLGVDLSFQDFESEVHALPGAYAPPRGRLLLATHSTTPVGCVALRDAGGARAEMKRLFVRPGTRGLGVGKSLVSRILSEALAMGFADVVLDTLPTMVEAQRLYEQFGFEDTAPYRPNPIAGSRYLIKVLSGA